MLGNAVGSKRGKDQHVHINETGKEKMIERIEWCCIKGCGRGERRRTSAIFIQWSIMSARFPRLSHVRIDSLTHAASRSLVPIKFVRLMTAGPFVDRVQLRHSCGRILLYDRDSIKVR